MCSGVRRILEDCAPPWPIRQRPQIETRYIERLLKDY